MKLETITPEQLVEKVERISKGSGGIIMVPLNAWRSIQSAYDSPLIRIIEEVSLVAHPQRSYPSRKLSFRVRKE